MKCYWICFKCGSCNTLIKKKSTNKWCLSRSQRLGIMIYLVVVTDSWRTIESLSSSLLYVYSSLRWSGNSPSVSFYSHNSMEGQKYLSSLLSNVIYFLLKRTSLPSFTLSIYMKVLMQSMCCYKNSLLKDSFVISFKCKTRICYIFFVMPNPYFLGGEEVLVQKNNLNNKKK